MDLTGVTVLYISVVSGVVLAVLGLLIAVLYPFFRRPEDQ